MVSVMCMCPPMLQHLDEDIGSGHAGALSAIALRQDQDNLWLPLAGFDDPLGYVLVCAGCP